MTRLILIRHGETDWNMEGRWQGQIDVPLNGRGREQARVTAEELFEKPIAAIYSSDLIRAVETARPLAELKGMSIQTDPRLREIHQGLWQGMLASVIEYRFGEQLKSRTENPGTVAPPGGESIQQVYERLFPVISEILDRHPEETVAVVTHGFVIALFQVNFGHESLAQVWKNIPSSGAWREYHITQEDMRSWSI